MKASKLLSFVLSQNLNVENGCDHVFIDDDDVNFGTQEEFIETFFGIKPTKKIPNGEYLYVYSDAIIYDGAGVTDDVISQADLVLETFEERERNYKIYLFRIED